MADTTFIDGTVIEPAWLNDVNDWVYNRQAICVNDFGASSSASASVNAAAFQAALDHAISVRNGCDVLFPDEYYEVDATTVFGYRAHTTEPDDIRKLGGVKLIGRGGGNNDSIFEGDGGTTIEYTGAGGGIFDISSAWDVTVERFLLKCSAASTPAYITRVRSELSPVITGSSARFRQVVFQAKSAPTLAQMVLRDCKGVVFEDCRWPTSLGTYGAVLIGENSGVNATLVNGQVVRPVFQNCIFSGDITIRQCQLLKFDSCEWFPRKGTSEGAKITLDGDKEVTSILFINPKSETHGTATGYFLDMATATGKGGLTVIGGNLGAYDCVFRTAPFGHFIAKGVRFIQQVSGDNDIILTAGVGPVDIDCNHTDTIAAANIPIVDNRTLPIRPYFVSASLGADHTFASTNFEDVVSQASVQFKGGMLRVRFGFTILSARSTIYEARVRFGATNLTDCFCRQSITNGNLQYVQFERVIPSPAFDITAGTLRLQLRQLTTGGSDWSTVQANDTVDSTFLQIEELT